MRPSLRLSVSVLAIAFVATACSRKNEPDAFVRATMKAASGEPQALWTALPPSYQKDVQGLLVAASEKMKPELYDEGFVLIQKTVKVLETKKEFVLGHPQMKGLPVPPDALSAWEPAVRALSRIVSSDLSTVEGLKKLDVEKLLAGPIAASMEDLVKVGEAAATAAPGQAPKITELRSKLQTAKITILSQEGDTAKVQIEATGEKPETMEMVKVEERWIPKELADAWPGAMAQAKAGLAGFEVPPEAVVQFNAMKGVLGPVLDGLLAAKTQEAFNAEIDTAMKALLGPMLAQRPTHDAPPDALPEADPVPSKKRRGSKSGRRRAR